MISFKTNSRKKSAMINSFVGLVSLLIPLILQFYYRKVFLEYLNIELLGLSGTFDSILGALSLTELGFQTAIVYCLYKPLKDNNIEEINNIVNILRVIYNIIGVIFIIIPFITLPFLHYLIKDIEITNLICTYFIIISLNSSLSYFLAYKRCLLFADQKEFISKIVDLAINVSFSIIQIILIICFSNYLLVISVDVIRVIISNIIILLICKKIYPYLHKTSFSWEIFRRIWGHVKDIMVLKFAAYVYRSTDNLLISSFISTIKVGYLANYTIITNKLTMIANGMLVPISPIIGNLLLEKDKNNIELIFRTFTFIRYIIASCIVVPTYILMNDLINIWLGSEYVLATSILSLLMLDVYINLYYTACCDYMGASGLFSTDKYIAIIGALLNIIISVIGAITIGVVGVLLGTIISQMFFWISRSYITYKHCFGLFSLKNFINYCIRCIIHLCFIILLIFVISRIYSNINHTNSLLDVFIYGIMIVLIVTISIFIVFWKTPEVKFINSNFIKKLCS